jgi:hypothetical protein
MILSIMTLLSIKAISMSTLSIEHKIYAKCFNLAIMLSAIKHRNIMLTVVMNSVTCNNAACYLTGCCYAECH